MLQGSCHIISCTHDEHNVLSLLHRMGDNITCSKEMHRDKFQGIVLCAKIILVIIFQ